MSLVGRLEDLALSDIFQILSIGRKTGSLIIKGKDGNAAIVFRNGLVVRAEVDFLKGDIGEQLFERGIIKEDTFSLAKEVKKRLPQKGITEVLIELGVVSKDVMEKAVKKRVEEIVYNLLLWQDGNFQFEVDEMNIANKVNLSDCGWELSKGISPEYLLMEGARVYDEKVAQEEFSPSEDLAIKEEPWMEGAWEGKSERRDISALRSLTTELRFPTTTSEITLLILRFASDIFQRGILFMVGKTSMAGLGQFGLGLEGADDKIREITIPLARSPFFSKIISSQFNYYGRVDRDEGTELLLSELGSDWPKECAIFPIVAEGKTVALLYCDNSLTGESFGETEGLEIFISQAGLALEKSLLERRVQELEKFKGDSSPDADTP
ncbi:MAG: DUF4388 domain-containing protein [Nitrospirae bacterium]|nr:DUF4388 domain-containing protein [Nitrospirota bacterium]